MAFVYQYERESLMKSINDAIEKYDFHGRVLDVGAGQVLRYKKFFKNGIEYFTQDIKQASSFEHNFVGDAKTIDALDASFDVIISTQVLEHVPEPWLVVKEMDRLLKKGGFCLLTVPQANELHEAPYDFYRYTKYGVEHLGEMHGWKALEIKPLGDYWTARVRESQRFAIETLDVYQRPWLAKLLSVYYRLHYKIAILMDRRCVPMKIKEKFAFGWVAVFQKPL